ncbi:MAG TPA: hypothetical protein VKM94_09230 [Blastocatellia bacterium]|nr:hypothetical protein [Blastocatellia bacterium]
MLKTNYIGVVLIILLCALAGSAQKAPRGSAQGGAKKETTLDFNQTQYLHRWSQNDQHEFTPQHQEDLSKWIDMITINVYRQVKDGGGLAAVANQVLENYKSHRGIVIKTDSVPAAAGRPAEHLIVVVLGTPGFLEAVQARFKLINGKGAAIIHSHRVYGKEVGNEMSEWLKLNGQSLEKTLMSWDPPPSLSSLGL